MDGEIDEDVRQPVVENPGGPFGHLPVADMLPGPVDEDVLAKGGAQEWLASDGAGKLGVEARANAVVLVQDVHPLAARKIDAAIPVAGNAAMLAAGMKLHPAEARIGQKPGPVEIRRAVIDESDLHVFGRNSRSEHALDRFTQQPRIGIPARDHHRPERLSRAIRAVMRALVHARRRYSE